ncbi:hypothetical protein [Aquamicrobium zhengzhouense]|uniref:Transposase n=1 Tax=Aquamicrobium zhengzhouense TaxID=2781738 RepID=A0ABS0SA11_9HYPH|nr:hypothetical protein [Aquamicrobium zhengzhouense]MBI1620120.1 hypothetical protein [Aquamicrobium zhengzhouense]
MTSLPYIYRWNRQGRKDQPCRVLSRSRFIRAIETPRLAFGPLRAARFNTILVEFADGYRMTTSGNAIRKVKP